MLERAVPPKRDLVDGVRQTLPQLFFYLYCVSELRTFVNEVTKDCSSETTTFRSNVHAGTQGLRRLAHFW